MGIPEIITLVVGIIGAIASIAVGSASAGVSAYNNAQQQKLAEEQFNYAKETNEQARQDAATSVQTRAKDLAEAGINPMLAGLSGAQVAQGSIYNGFPSMNNPMSEFGNIGDIIAGIGGNYTHAKSEEETERANRENEQIEKMKTQIERYNANTNRYIARIDEQLKSRDLTEEERKNLSNEKIANDRLKQENEKIKAEIEKMRADAQNDATRIQNEYDVEQAQLEVNRISNQLRLREITAEEAKIKLEQLKEQNRQKEWKWEYGRSLVFGAIDKGIDIANVAMGRSITIHTGESSSGTTVISNYDNQGNYKGGQKIEKQNTKQGFWDKKFNDVKRRTNKRRKK